MPIRSRQPLNPLIAFLRTQARRSLERTALGRSLLRRYRERHEHQRNESLGHAQAVFTHHFETRAWNNDESLSGPGSTLQYTENIRKELPILVDRLGVTRILDAPCGDFNWFQAIPWTRSITYQGGDIVPALVAQNQSRYGQAGREFSHLDITRDPLPPADLWLCRDCLFHLSNEDIHRALQNFLRSGIPYLLTSTHPGCDVIRDIPTGSFRLLNLCLPPFRLGPPVLELEDWIEGFPERRLSLWRREDIAVALTHRL